MTTKSKTETNNRSVLVVFPKNQLANLEKVQDMLGLVSRSEVIRMAVSEVCSRVLAGGYISNRYRAGAPIRQKLSSTEKKELEKISLCDALDGQLIDKNGSKTCKYIIYEKINPKLVEKFEQEIPLSYLTEKTVEDQYKPDRETCEKILEKQN